MPVLSFAQETKQTEQSNTAERINGKQKDHELSEERKAEQQETANFWDAVTPKSQEYDAAKLEECLSLIRKLPTITLDKQPEIACLGIAISKQNQLHLPDYKAWLEESLRLKRLGYKDCSLSIFKALLKARPSANPDLLLSTYAKMVVTYIQSGDNRNADTLAIEGMRLSDSLGLEHAEMLYAAAYANHRNRRTELARQQAGRALELARKNRDGHLQIRVHSLMGIINRDVFFGHSLKAIPDHTEALALAKSLKDTSCIVNELVALAFNYEDAGDFNRYLDYLNEALGYLSQFEILSARLRIQNAVSERLFEKNRNNEAIKLRLEALREAELSGSFYAADICLRLYGMYMKLGKLVEAKVFLDKAATLYQKAGMQAPDKLGLEESYYEFAKKTGQPEMALQHLENAYAAVSENYVMRNSELLSRLETQYRTGEKEKLLQIAHRQRTLLLLFAGLITLLGGITFFYYLKQKKTSSLLAKQNFTIREQTIEIKSLEGLKSRFFANVSHELRTPLTLMLGPLDSILKIGGLLPDKERKMLEFVKKNSQYLLKLVNEILDLSKLETGRLEVKEDAVNFHQFLQLMLAQFNLGADNDTVEFLTNYRFSHDLNIWLDKGKFEKIIHNFLSNAIKFTPAAGSITITVEEIGNLLQVKIEDSGPGIHPDDMPHIFDRFYQSKQPDAPVQGGTGIGLSMAKELAELMGGKIWAESTLGQGSSFYFQFPKKTAENSKVHLANMSPAPKVEEPASTSPIAEIPHNAKESQQKSTILVVEDNPDLREYLRILLCDDYEVVIAENGKVAWDMLYQDDSLGIERFLPNLIVSDIMMPIMDGFKLLEKVKGQDSLRHIPFIMLTARTEAAVKLSALRIGVDDYLVKPFMEEELKARIRNLLSNYRTRLETTADSTEDLSTSTPDPLSVISAADSEWLIQVENIFSQKLSDTHFKIDWAANLIHLSERQFTRRIKQVTGLTPNQYLREMRLQTAKKLLHEGKYATVKEVVYAVGFLDTTYFSQIFKERFGVHPSAYIF